MTAALPPGVLRRADYERQGQARLPLSYEPPPTTMKITVSARDFAPAAAQAARICATVTTLPVLKNILLEVSAGKLRVAATDLESTLDIRLPATDASAEDGAVTVSAKLLAGLVGSLGSSEITLTAGGDDGEETQLRVQSRSGEYKLATLRPEEFPEITNACEANPATLDAATLRDALLQTAPYTDPADTRVVCKAIRILASPGSILVSATNSFVYSRRQWAVPGFTEQYEALIPATAAREICEVLKGGGDCRLCADGNQLSVYAGGTVLTVRVFEGTCGNIEKRFTPASNPHSVGVNRDELAAAMKRLLLIADQKTTVHPVEFDFSADELTLSATTDNGAVRETLALVGSVGEPETVHLNAYYLQQALQVLRAETIELRLADGALRPVFLTPANDAEQRIWVMPVDPARRA